MNSFITVLLIAHMSCVICLQHHISRESIPAMISSVLKKEDKKFSYYREHTHALSSGVDPKKILAELCMKGTGCCQGAGGSMHIYDKQNRFQGGWALVAEQLPYSAGAAKSILLDSELGLVERELEDGNVIKVDSSKEPSGKEDDRLLVDGLHAEDVAKAGRAVTDYIRSGQGPAVMQIHTYRFMGHSPADPEHERGRKEEKAWARQNYDPIKAFEAKYTSDGTFTAEELKAAKKDVQKIVNDATAFADSSPEPNADLAKDLEYPTPHNTDYNSIVSPSFAEVINQKTISSQQMERVNDHIDALMKKAEDGLITIAEAVNLAIHEEMLRDPTTTLQAEDLQAGSSYGIPGMTQQTYGSMR